MINNGITLWFRCFKGQHNPEAYKTSLIIEGISYIYNLFKDKDYNIIFLADRWFPNCEIMKYIDSIGHTYKNKYETKLAVSKSDTHKEALYILSNKNIENAIENYSYRFGSIEFIFKNQKSNGFYLESTKMRNIHAFTTLFGLMCIALLWLTIIGVDYSKNISKHQNYLKIRCYKKDKNSIKRSFSLFNTGLLYFNLLFNSNILLKIKCNFILYEL